MLGRIEARRSRVNLGIERIAEATRAWKKQVASDAKVAGREKGEAAVAQGSYKEI